MIDPQELASIAVGARLASVLPHIEDELARMDAQIEKEVLQRLEDGTLTADAAMDGWMAKRATRRLLRNLRTRVRIGEAAGEKLKEL